jgi:hypothetical protein
MLLATVRGSVSFCAPRAASGLLTTGLFTTRGAPAGRRSSSDVPHIPQNLKFDELSSPQFGQIKIVSPDVFPNSLTPVRPCHLCACLPALAHSGLEFSTVYFDHAKSGSK